MLKKSFTAAALALGTTAALASGVTGPTVIPYRTIDADVMNFNATVTVTPGGYVIATQDFAEPKVTPCDEHFKERAETYYRHIPIFNNIENHPDLHLPSSKEIVSPYMSGFTSVIDSTRFTVAQCQKSAHPVSSALYNDVMRSIEINEAQIARILKAVGINPAP